MNFNLVKNLRLSFIKIAARLGLYQNRNEGYVDYLHSVINIREGMRILDVGGASGDILFKLIDDANQNNRGVVLDLDLEALQQGKKRGGNLEFVYSDAENMPFRNNIFHLALTITVLEYLSKPSRCIKELSRIIKDDGFIFVVLPNLQWFIEPYTKWPLLSFLPKAVQKKVMDYTPTYTHINLDVNIKNIVTAFINERFIQIYRFPIYHSRFMKFLFWPPSWRIYFKKRTRKQNFPTRVLDLPRDSFMIK